MLHHGSTKINAIKCICLNPLGHRTNLHNPSPTSPLDAPANAYDALLNHTIHRKAIKPAMSPVSSCSSPSSSSLSLSKRRRPETRHCNPPLDISPEEYLQAKHQFESAPDRPLDLKRTTMWFGMEPDVERNFFVWDRDVPRDIAYIALAGWDAGQLHINEMSGKLKTALIHVIAEAMFRGHLHPYRITFSQIQFLLERTLAKLKSDSSLAYMGEPQRAHWLYGTMRSREEELEWLKYQAERRWWIMMSKTLEVVERYRWLSCDNELFNQYLSAEAHD
ncbi:hypothetical protein M422DRAFT_244358 [Sphaerobolus stellatus SS14]|uniref:Uncharacterized protein n=1 Tax=Sphaerobolus stellatus (strain SS14) TaxID=990650 RepID=A0A0C9UD06_SPHS4|nr:hypothetical protein M422DRAFT_276602 [Sphaerobolus stellatus SS14]KIJ51166.1 hypothetical protein M422DRAFT_244358 [Sphaerobolus stellatus SS14]